jgi:polysaccharide chain length determinant protein (PEP-CTERM system associated)
MQATLNQVPAGAEINLQRTLDLEDYLAIARRNISWLLGPALAALTLAVVIAFFWPNTYNSVAAIRVVPPAVPEKLVPTNVSVQMAERVAAMQQTILSRNTLTNIIQTYDLYRRERSRLPMEDIIEKMQRNISVSGLTALGGGGSGSRAAAFRIGFAYENRYVAQKVTRDLMTRFIDENIRERFSQSQQTTQFLRDQFDQKKLELDAIDQKLTTFRQANIGRLPDSMGSNIQQIGVLESRVSSLNTNISRARQEQMMLETDLRATREKLNALNRIRDVPSSGGGGSSASGANGPSETEIELARVERELQQLERGLERMLEQYKPTYPDVQRLQFRISSLKKERDDLQNRKLAVREPGATSAAAAPARTATSVTMNPQRAREVAEMESQITRLQGAIRGKEIEVDRYQREIGDAERRSKELQNRIEMGPVGATQLEQMMRDYEIAKKGYDDLKMKLAQSQVASDLEERKQGETLEVLDLPSLPEQPTAPNRPVIVGAGVVIGFLIGFAMVTMRELKDNSLKTLKDIRAYTQFNVLGSIPLIENDLVVRRQRRLSVLGWSTACLLAVLIMAGSIYYHFSTQV